MVWNYENIRAHLPDLSILRHNWREFQNTTSTHEVSVQGATIGGERPTLIAGPCAVETQEQTLAIAKVVHDMGIRLLRGGAFKPRTNPHDFQGLGVKGLEILSQAREEFGLGIVTEVMDPRMVEIMMSHADMFQIGSRSMYNYPLLKEVGKTKKPVLLKRAWCATLEEWLCAAEYIAKEGNKNIVLCERGIRTSVHWNYSRAILDLNIIEPLRRLTPLPVIVDPSHATGQWSLVPAIARSGLAAGAHGVLIEVALSGEARKTLKCDNEQGISPDQLKELHDFVKNEKVAPFTID